MDEETSCLPESTDDAQEFVFTEDDAQEVADRLREARLSEEYVDLVLSGAAVLLEACLERTNNWTLITEILESSQSHIPSWLTKDIENFGIKRRRAKKLATVVVDFVCRYAKRMEMRFVVKRLLSLVSDDDIELGDGELSIVALPLTTSVA